MVNPLIATVWLGWMWKMRKFELCEFLDTASKLGPGPLMVILSATTSSPLVRVMVCPFREESNSMVSPPGASASAWRSEPGPLSAVVVTVIVVAGLFLLVVALCASAKGITQMASSKRR